MVQRRRVEIGDLSTFAERRLLEPWFLIKMSPCELGIGLEFVCRRMIVGLGQFRFFL